MDICNPFDDPNLHCVILVNSHRQYSVWPQFAPIPAGWYLVAEAMPAGDCQHWLRSHCVNHTLATQH